MDRNVLEHPSPFFGLVRPCQDEPAAFTRPAKLQSIAPIKPVRIT